MIDGITSAAVLNTNNWPLCFKGNGKVGDSLLQKDEEWLPNPLSLATCALAPVPAWCTGFLIRRDTAKFTHMNFRDGVAFEHLVFDESILCGDVDTGSVLSDICVYNSVPYETERSSLCVY